MVHTLKKNFQSTKLKKGVILKDSLKMFTSKVKSKILINNKWNNNQITQNGKVLEEVEAFTYLDSTINKQGGLMHI